MLRTNRVNEPLSHQCHIIIEDCSFVDGGAFGGDGAVGEVGDA